MSDYRRIAKNSAFRRLALAQFFSSMGDWMKIGFLVSLTLQLSGGSATAVAGIMIAKMLPALLFSTAINVLAERFDQRRLMIVSDLARASLIFLLVLSNSLMLIYVVLFLMELCSRFYWPARNTLAIGILDEDDQRSAVGFLSATKRVAMVVGLAASGLVIRGFEHAIHFFMNADSLNIVQSLFDFAPVALQTRIGYLANVLVFLISALMIFSLRTYKAQLKERLVLPPFKLRELAAYAAAPFRFLYSKVELRTIIVAVSLAVLGGSAALPIALSYITTLKGSLPLEDSLAWVASFSSSHQIFLLFYLGLGAAIGFSLFGHLKVYVSTGLLFSVAMLVFSLGIVAFAFNEYYVVACALAFAGGLCAASVLVAGSVYLERHVEYQQRIQVFAASESVLRAAIVLSALIFTPLSDALTSIVQQGIQEIGIGEIVALDPTGQRITMLISALIVAIAAIYSFKTLYLKGRQ